MGVACTENCKCTSCKNGKKGTNKKNTVRESSGSKSCEQFNNGHRDSARPGEYRTTQEKRTPGTRRWQNEGFEASVDGLRKRLQLSREVHRERHEASRSGHKLQASAGSLHSSKKKMVRRIETSGKPKGRKGRD